MVRRLRREKKAEKGRPVFKKARLPDPDGRERKQE
jgi:hypothetical protein